MKYKALGDFSAVVRVGGPRQDVQAGEIYDLPDTQDGTPDGPPLVYDPAWWEPVKEPSKSTAKKEG